MYKVRIEDTGNGQVIEYDASRLIVVGVRAEGRLRTFSANLLRATCEPKADVALWVTFKKQIEDFYRTPYGAILRGIIEGTEAPDAESRIIN